MDLPAIDTKQTIKRAKKKLREYPRWREIAHDSMEQATPLNHVQQLDNLIRQLRQWT